MEKMLENKPLTISHVDLGLTNSTMEEWKPRNNDTHIAQDGIEPKEIKDTKRN